MNQKQETQLQQYTNVIFPELKEKLKTITDKKEEISKNLIVTQNELEKLINFVDENENKK